MISEEEIKRRIAFVPCTSKEALHAWIKLFLGLDFPDRIVDEESTSSPMDIIWELYDKALKNDDPQFNRVIAYASRDSMKTAAASVFEVLCMVHLDRSVAHMAAVEAQARKAQEYVKAHLNKPILRDFVIGNNVRKVHLVRYEHKETGANIPEKEWQALSTEEQGKHERRATYTTIIIATVQGANSEHVPFMCVDGQTEIKVKNKEGQKRTRKSYNARGIFKRIAGLNPGGRTGGETDLVIRTPQEIVEVLSVNLETGATEFKKILAASQTFKEAYEVKTENGDVICSDEHPFWVLNKGYVKAGLLQSGDKLIRINRAKGLTQAEELPKVSNNFIFNHNEIEVWEQVLLGSLMGDCGIYKKPTNNPYIQEQHCVKQKEYMDWKWNILKTKLHIQPLKNPLSGYTKKTLVGYRSGNSEELLPYKNIRSSLEGIEKIDALGLAIWYMDDGCAGNGFRLSTEGWGLEDNIKIQDFLNKKFGIKTAVKHYFRKNKIYYYIKGGVEAKRRLVEICKQYIHPDMSYKFSLDGNIGNCKYCGNEYWFYEADALSSVTCGDPICKKIQSETFKVDSIVSVKAIGKRWLYDFTIEDNHNFIANGILVSNCVDEVDIIRDPKAYEEAKMIPAPYKGLMPITLLTSTRKYNFGLVQKEIDESAKSGIHVRHWNIIDVTEGCPPERHLPEEPKITIYRSDESLRAISEDEYLELSGPEQESYVKDTGFKGCLKNCALFASCKSRLATHQRLVKKEDRSKEPIPLLKPIEATIASFRAVSVEMAKAQLLCKKPSTEGLVFPSLNEDIHYLTPAQIGYRATGELQDPSLDKQQLISLLKLHQIPFVTGVDWGFTHMMVAVTIAIVGRACYVIDVIAETELLPDQIIDLFNKKIRHFDSDIYADTENPQMNSYLAAKKFKVREWEKGPGSVLTGIEIMRMKQMPGRGEPELYFLKGDEMVSLLFLNLSQYHWKKDAAGRYTDVPEKDGPDHYADATRYPIMSIFKNSQNGSSVLLDIGAGVATGTPKPANVQSTANKSQWQEIMGHVMGHDVGETTTEDDENETPGGGFSWSF